MNNAIPQTLLVVVFLAGLAIIGQATPPAAAPRTPSNLAMPAEGAALGVRWGDLGKQLVVAGVIDRQKLGTLYGALTKEQELLLGVGQEELHITEENAPYLLNLLWALGLGNRNPILEAEMMDPRFGGASGFASTAGWIIATGDPMGHYNKHALIPLAPAQQTLVDEVSQHIYRPCCDNSTHFPDCNHGMAMLALLELMASQGKSESELYSTALVANTYWFPEQYQTIAAYFALRGLAWKNVSPKEVLGKEYSSASGYARVAKAVQPREPGGASCSV